LEENRQEVENEQNTESDQEVLERIEKKRRRTARYNFFALGVLVGLLVAFLLTVVLVGGGILNPGAQLAAGSVSKTDDTVLTSEVKNKIGLLEDSIHEYYLGDTTNDALETGIYKGMVDALRIPNIIHRRSSILCGKVQKAFIMVSVPISALTERQNTARSQA
jgi:predicted nucleic acid-binding Zn ribbon protein